MIFNTYYINLKQDKQRNQETIAELNKTNLIYQRFEAINGKAVDKQELIHQNIIMKYCKYYLIDKTIGCGASHIHLLHYVKKRDKNKFCLILEDDIFVTNPELNYTQEINDIVDKYNKKNIDWDIIRLHSFFYGTGSTAAYIVNINNIEKIKKNPLYNHIDIQQSNDLKVYSENKLFNTRDHLIHYRNPFYNIYFDNQTIGYYFNQPAGKLWGRSIFMSHFFYSIIFLLLFFKKYKTFILFILFIIVVIFYNNIFINYNNGKVS